MLQNEFECTNHAMQNWMDASWFVYTSTCTTYIMLKESIPMVQYDYECTANDQILIATCQDDNKLNANNTNMTAIVVKLTRKQKKY